ncbi:MAG TPA: ATP-binding protein [Thermoanaerobaculia bacterium]|nr:ATP-binding protein [Thermoanaerobaculia bacterium]
MIGTAADRQGSDVAARRLVRILHVEDNPRDAELMGETLAEDGIECEILRVEDREAFAAALDRGGFDVIVCDYSIPSFHGDDALSMARSRRPEAPFLYLSGTIGEEKAVEALKGGATEYVLKGNLSKLPSAVRRALAEAKERADRRRAEEALRDSEQRYRRLFERNLAGVFRSTADGKMLECNLAFARIFGYESPEELLAVPASELYVRPSDRAAALERIRREGTILGYETSLRRRDGSLAWILENVTLLPGEDGGPEILEGTLIDVTERKRLEEQFREVQKMEAVGRLAGGVAHDFNNILTAILGYTDLLGASLSAANPLREEVEGIRNAAQRASALTRQLLAFSRRQVLVVETVDLNVLVRDMERMLHRVIGQDIRISTECDPLPARVRADRGQLEQVLVNLVINARDAMPAGGSIRIRTRNSAAEDGSPEVVLTVADNGTGMDADTVAHIFEPFYTTKEKGKGTGLGLATVYGIVEQSGGRIEVSSEVGRGSVFRVRLPPIRGA